MSESDHKCEFCQWWKRGEVHHTGECRVHPPKATLNQRIGKMVVLVPETRPDFWCGSWVPNQKWADRQQHNQSQTTLQNQNSPNAGGCPACRDTGVIDGQPCPCQDPPNVRALEFNQGEGMLKDDD